MQNDVPIIAIDFETCEIYVNHKKLKDSLTFKERDLVSFLSRNKGKIFSKEELYKNVWGYDFGSTRIVELTVLKTRYKIEEKINSMIIFSKNGGYFIPETCNIQVGDLEKILSDNNSNNSSEDSKFEEIKKYKELLDLNIITQEEFESKKKELLSL